MSNAGEGNSENLATPLHQHLTSVAQVTGEEYDDADLGELSRLEDDSTRQPDAKVRAVCLLANAWHPRQKQQHQRCSCDRPAVVLKTAVVAQEDDRD